jgi:acyl carrier protein
MYGNADISSFLASQLGVDEATLAPDDSLLDDCGVDGDDFDDLMEAFSQRFEVDLSGYRWEFHHQGEAGLSSLFFRHTEDRIAVTPRLLLECANAGKWPIEYPSTRRSSRWYEFPASVVLLFGIILLFPNVIMRLIELFGKVISRGR